MANTICYVNKKEILNGGIDFLTDTICIALLGVGYTPSDAHATWSDVSANEIAGTGYIAGGAVLTSKTVATDATAKRGYFTSASALWSAATLSARWGAIYKRAGGSPVAGDKLIAILDLNATISSTDSNFEIIPNATNGWFAI